MPPILAKLPTRSRLILAGGALAVVLVAFLMLRMAGAPSYSPLASGLEPADTGKVTEALDAKGIPYELQANGTTVAVEKAQVAEARVAIAETGVSAGGKGSAPGFEIFDKQKLGASDFQQQVAYQRALEGEIANTIQQVNGVSGAQVRLVLPEEELFSDESTPATAAVLLSGSDGMEPAAVKGIAQLVSSSVKGLKPESVTITDGTGQVVWPSGEGGAGMGAGGTTKLAAEQRYERALEGSIMAMLARTVGPEKAQVQVKAQLNVDKTQREVLTYDRRAVPLETETETERLRGAGGGVAGGRAGAAGNIPGYAAGGAAGGDTNYRREVDKTKNGVGKRVERTEVAQGQVEDLSVALMLDSSVPPAVADQIRSSVASAAGVNRMDVTMTTLAFAGAKPAEKPAAPVAPALFAQAKWAGLALAAFIFLFFMWRHLRRRESEALDAPAWLTEISQPVPLKELAGGADQTRVLEPPTIVERQPDPAMFRLEHMIEKEPQRVAAQVKQWMAEG